MIRRLPRSILFPYPTLFRSDVHEDRVVLRGPPPCRPGAVVVGPDDLVEEVLAAEDAVEQDLAVVRLAVVDVEVQEIGKITRLNSSHANISYAVFCLKKKTY